MDMNQKTAWAIIACIVFIGAAAYVFMSGVGRPVPQSVGTVSTTTNQPAAMPANPTAGTINARTSTSITVAAQGASRTFAITPSTVVRSVVAAGVAGKSAADLTVGASVFVIPLPSDPNTAGVINLPPPLPPKPGPGAVALSGKVSAVSSGSMTLTLGDNTTKKVLVSSKTTILSNVSAGQKGKGLSDLKGLQVQVLGTTTSGSITAQTVLVIQ